MNTAVTGLPDYRPTGADALFRPLFVSSIEPRMDRAVLILRAPRACGKTELVEIITERLAIPPEHIIDGKAHDAAQALIDLQKAIRSTPDSSISRLVIDDADELILRNPVDSERGEGLRTAFETLISDANASKPRVRLVLTITLPPERINEPSQLISDVLRTTPIEPTALPEAIWRAALQVAVAEVVHDGQHQTWRDKSLAESLFQLSGGHPSLMVAGLDALGALFGVQADPELERRREDDDFVRGVVTAAMRYDGGRPIRKQILRMRDVNSQEEAALVESAFDALKSQLDVAGHDFFTLPVPQGELLLAAGLIRLVDPRLPGTFALWGGQFVEVVRTALAAPAQHTFDSSSDGRNSTIRSTDTEAPKFVEPRPLPGSRRGELRLVSPDGEQPTANLTPQSWLIASEIIKANGGVISVKRICDLLFPETSEGEEEQSTTAQNMSKTMTAIQRMLKEIARTTERPIVNVRGEGYRFDREHYQLRGLVNQE
ncbi:MAG: hypothetical protein IBJ03_11005 [Gemmatimonadaceae bacterium]|nr:hypothetical protein [Gemmatimonadaceae bacterium]